MRYLILACLSLMSLSVAAVEEDPAWELSAETFDDTPLEEELVHPPWFKLSFLDLPEDLREAVDDGKRGLIVYFGQKFCPYCQALMEVNFGKPDIVEYTRRHFDVVAINIHGSRMVTDMQGNEISERDLAEREGTDFTPSLIFYDRDGKEALRLRGYHPPYKFRAALEYAADGHYKEESFRDFLNRAEQNLAFEIGGLNEEAFFAPPPYALERVRFPAEKPLIVLFEQGDCHACDVLHSQPLQDPAIRELLGRFETVQLDMWSDTPVITPKGVRTDARRWADELGLFYTPTLIFFDHYGEEIIRVDSVAYFYRLQRVLQYVLSGVWQQGVSLQAWRRQIEREVLLDQLESEK